MSKLNPYQRILCQVYGGGDYKHIKDSREATPSTVGDGFFLALMVELSTGEECTSLATARTRMAGAMRDCEIVLQALEKMGGRKAT